jgi:hypothetical protein
MPRIAENPEVKKKMVKLAACTKKVRKLVREGSKINHQWLKMSKKNNTKKETKEEKKLRVKRNKFSTKTVDVINQCEKVAIELDDMKNLVRKPDTRIKIQKLMNKFDQHETDWSSNTDSFKRTHLGVDREGNTPSK